MSVLSRLVLRYRLMLVLSEFGNFFFQTFEFFQGFANIFVLIFIKRNVSEAFSYLLTVDLLGLFLFLKKSVDEWDVLLSFYSQISCFSPHQVYSLRSFLVRPTTCCSINLLLAIRYETITGTCILQGYERLR